MALALALPVALLASAPVLAQSLIGAVAFQCDGDGICGEIDGSIPADALDEDATEPENRA